MAKDGKDDRLIELRKLLDPKRLPEYDLILNGELIRFVSDDPLEERTVKVLYQ